MSNPCPFIKRIAILLSFFIASIPALAQNNWYVFIQAENNQPFYARMAGRVFSSTSIGYLVIPELRDSVYDLVIGFPEKQMSEQRFSVPINKKDHGFELKSNGNSWSLFNWQTQESMHPLPNAKNDNIYYGERKKDDPFAEMMAAVVSDSAVLYKSAINEEKPKLVKKPARQADSVVAINETPKKPDEEKAQVITKPADTATKQPDTNLVLQNKVTDSTSNKRVSKPDSTIVAKVEIPKDSVAGKIVKSAPVLKKNAEEMSFSNPMIVKLEDRTSKTYRKIVYTDATGNKTDTITILIPITPAVPQGPKKPILQVDSAIQKNKDTIAKETKPPVRKDSTVIVKKDSTIIANPPKKDSVVTKPAANTNTDTTKSSVVAPSRKPLEMVNSNCHNIATDNDIDKLRVKMIESSNLDGKLNAARKLFKAKCLTSKQIKALSELFITDEEKFSFFEACYSFVDDTDNFKQLYILLTNKNVIDRFKTMVHLQ